MSKCQTPLARSVYLLLLLSSIALPLEAGDFGFSVNADKTVTITSYAGPGGAVEIPREIDGQKVAVIGKKSFMRCVNLTSLTIPDSVTTIESGRALSPSWPSWPPGHEPDGAFSACTNLTSVTFGKGLKVLGDYAFAQCKALTNVSLPTSVTRIGHGSFANCSALRSVDLPVGLMEIGSSAFENCVGLSNVSLPDKLTLIDAWAFHGCTGLKTMAIPDSVVTIGTGAFRYCSGLTDVTVGRGVVSVRRYAFSSCGALRRLRFNCELPREPGSDLFFGTSGVTVYDATGATVREQSQHDKPVSRSSP
jgi:hypothetical protein